MDSQEYDVDNARAVIGMELFDIATTLIGQVTTAEAAILSDRVTALGTQLFELHNADVYQRDRRMQESIYQAMLSDCKEVDMILDEEKADANVGVQDGSEVSDNDTTLRTIGKDGYYDDHRVDPEGHTQLTDYVDNLAADETHPPRECYICLEGFPHSMTVEVGDCSHVWCRGCLTRRFEMALKNENHHPVRCCVQTPNISPHNSPVSAVLGTKLVSSLEAKVVEYETQDRTYCHMPTCSTFINPSTITGLEARCPRPSCYESTCASCKGRYHGAAECDVVPDHTFEQWRDENEAATCPSCHRVIIISHGCNHMRSACALSHVTRYANEMLADAIAVPNSATNATPAGKATVHVPSGESSVFWKEPQGLLNASAKVPMSSSLQKESVKRKNADTTTGRESTFAAWLEARGLAVNAAGRLTFSYGNAMAVGSGCVSDVALSRWRATPKPDLADFDDKAIRQRL